MNGANSNDVRSATLGTVTLVGIAIVFVLMCYGVVSYPASVEQGGRLNFCLSVGALLVYAGAAGWVWQKANSAAQIALAQGARIGLLLTLIAAVNLALEHSMASTASLSAVRGVSMWGLMFLLFGSAASTAFRKTGSVRLAVLASLWSGVIGAIGMLLSGFALALLFMPHMEHILAPAFAHSGMTDPRAFVIRNTLEAAATHLLFVPVVAGAFGFLGGCASALFMSLRRSVAISLGVIELLLFLGGLASIRFATTLERSERPPFIMFSFFALGIALACAPSVFAAIRRPDTTP